MKKKENNNKACLLCISWLVHTRTRQSYLSSQMKGTSTLEIPDKLTG